MELVVLLVRKANQHQVAPGFTNFLATLLDAKYVPV